MKISKKNTNKIYHNNCKFSIRRKSKSINRSILNYIGGNPYQTVIKTGSLISSAQIFWDEKKKEGLDEKWYNLAIDKWSSKPASVSGVLDGYDDASAPDLKESGIFLDILANKYGKHTNKHIINIEGLRALDCGAGIGRITEGILMQRFDIVDLVEPVTHFIDKAKLNLSKIGHVGNFYDTSLQNFNPLNKYDCIWIQWVLGQLTDDDVITFLQKCKQMLTKNGVIIVKENMASSGFSVDNNYNLITRNYNDTVRLFNVSGLLLLHEQFQKDFPTYLQKVNMFALN